MGSWTGHLASGFGFFAVGLWHLFNHIKLHSMHPGSYRSRVWFPTSRVRYLELLLIIFGCSILVLMELFISPARHQPLDLDGTIPSYHLHTFEHSLISLTLITCAAFAIALDRSAREPARSGLTNLLAAVAFGQELLMFHFHSTDRMGVESQYHRLLKILIFACLSTSLISIYLPKSFLVGFVKSVSILFQGIWLVVIGIMLWTPGLIPKGCYMNLEDGHYVVRCHSDEALYRAKSLVSIEFGCFLILVVVFSVSLYLLLERIYGDKAEYQSLAKEELKDGEVV